MISSTYASVTHSENECYICSTTWLAQIIKTLSRPLLLFLIIFTLGVYVLQAQLPTDSIFRDQKKYRDTLQIKFLYKDGSTKVINDTSLTYEELFYNQIKTPLSTYVDLQHIGSPSMNLKWRLRSDLGFHMFANVFQGYDFTQHSLPIIQSNAPYANAYFNQSLSQSQHVVGIEFAKKFRQSSFQFHFRRINDLGLLQQQKNLHNNLFTFLHIPHQIGSIKLIYSSNIYQSKENGGVANLDGYTNPFPSTIGNIDLYMSSGQTRQQEKLGKILDSWTIINNPTFPIYIDHSIWFRNKYKRFYDKTPNQDFYQSFYSDPRGYRYFLKINTLGNSLYVRFENKNSTTLKYHLRAGLIHKFHWMTNYAYKEFENWTALHGEINTQYSNFFKLRGEFLQSFLPDIKDTRLGGTISFQLKEFIQAEAMIQFQRERPVILFQQFITTSYEQWKNNFHPINTFSIGGGIGVPFIGLSTDVYFHIIDQWIYFSSLDHIPTQTRTPIQLGQLDITYKKDFSFLYLRGKALFQLSSSDFINFPETYLSIGTGIRFSLFDNRMDITTGPYVRFMNKPIGYTYIPYIGDFVLSDSDSFLRSPYSLNFQLGLRIDAFSFFGHFENIEQLYNDPYSEVYHFPEGYTKIRIGLRWKLLN